MTSRVKDSLLRGKVREMLQAHADSVIKSVMEEEKISQYQLMKSHCVDHILARAKIVRQLHADGYSPTNILRVTGFNATTIASYLSEDIKLRRRQARNRYLEARA